MEPHERVGLILGLAVVLAVSAGPAGAQWVATHQYSVRNGLAQSQVTCITQDGHGYLWAGTQGGLSRFDGIRFEEYTTTTGLPDNIVTALAPSAHGVWIGTDVGLLARFEQGRIERAEGPPDLHGTGITGLSVVDAGLLVASRQGLFLGTPGSFRKILEEPIGRLVRTDETTVWAIGDEIWAITEDARTERIPLGRSFSNPVAVARAAGHTWAVSDDAVLVPILEEDLPGTRLDVSGTVTDMIRSPFGGLLVATDTGLWHRDPKGHLRRIQLSPAPRRHRVVCLYGDREKNLWVGTSGEGLFQRPPSAITVYTRESGLKGTMAWSFAQTDDGCIWMATNEGGVQSWCDDRWGRSLGVGDGLPSPEVLVLAADREGGLWIGTRNGLARRAGGHLQTWERDDGLPILDIRGISQDSAGNTWVCGDGGIAMWNGSRWTSWTRFEGFDRPLVRTIIMGVDGLVWFTIHGKGIVAFDGDRFQRFTTEDGLITDRVWCLTMDDRGRLWAGTDEGICILPRKGKRFTTVGTHSTLPSPIVLFLIQDASGAMWVGTSHGIARLDADGVPDLVLTGADGLPDSEASEGAAFRDASGHLWFGLSSGVARLAPDALVTNPVPPVIVLERIEANGRPVPGATPVATSDGDPGDPLVLGPGPVDLRFQFTATSLVSPRKVRFRYLLEGYDTGIGDPTSDRYVSYHRVPPGRYRFLLHASNNDGVWAPRPLSVEVRITPRWYGTAWFRILFGILVLGTIAMAVFVRLRAQERQRIRLEQEVEERTAELARASEQIQEQNRLLRELSRTDPLTGLGNRRVLSEHLPVEMAVLRRGVLREAPEDLSTFHGALLTMIDLDHFKRVNDVWGHEVGDRALRAVATSLEPVLREGDVAVRWGGEEFVVLNRAVDTRGALTIARRLLHRLADTSISAPDGTSVRLPASLGFFQFPLGTEGFLNGGRWPALLDLADRLLYLAKSRGRRRACGIVWSSGAIPIFTEEEVFERLARDLLKPPEPLEFAEIVLDGRHGEEERGDGGGQPS